MNWSTSIPVSSWDGVGLHEATDRVKFISLIGRGLNGRIPPDITKLDQLENLRLHRNNLGGGMPSELGDLSNLKILSLSFNDLTGVIPTELADLPKLRRVVAEGKPVDRSGLAKIWRDEEFASVAASRQRSTEAPFPSSLYSSANIKFRRGDFCREPSNVSVWFLKDCLLLMSIRDELAGRAILNWHVDLPVDSWDGVIIGGPETRVRGLVLPGAGLTGRIPRELGQLSGLTVVDLSDNQLKGSVPRELSQLRSLQELYLQENQFTGIVSPELYNVPTHDLLENLFCRRSPDIPPLLLDDCELLLATRDRISGNAAINWRENVPVGRWQGVTFGGVRTAA